jgi:hypothetical protein
MVKNSFIGRIYWAQQPTLRQRQHTPGTAPPHHQHHHQSSIIKTALPPTTDYWLGLTGVGRKVGAARGGVPRARGGVEEEDEHREVAQQRDRPQRPSVF